jgi:hypothetical protein
MEKLINALMVLPVILLVLSLWMAYQDSVQLQAKRVAACPAGVVVQTIDQGWACIDAKIVKTAI